MSSSTVPPPTQQQQQAPTAQQSQQGLPPTGLQQQMNSLNQLYQQVGQARGGFNVQQQQFQQGQQRMGGMGLQGPTESEPELPMGSSSLDQIARNLATRYGLPIGRGRLVDDAGNFLYTPQQLADASGGTLTMGGAAAQMNYISQALNQRRIEQQQQKGIAALQTGLGQVQSRARGSMAGMMSGYYQSLAQIYTDPNLLPEQQDFSYYIQKEQMDIQNEIQRRQEKMAKKRGRGQFFAGLGLTIAGLATGNAALITQGAGTAAGGAAESGWF